MVFTYALCPVPGEHAYLFAGLPVVESCACLPVPAQHVHILYSLSRLRGNVAGLMYLQLSHSLATGVSDRVASLWFAMAVLSFTPSYTAGAPRQHPTLL